LPRSTPQSAPAIDIPLPEPAAVDLTFPQPARPASEADGRGGAGQEKGQEQGQEQREDKRSETDARSKFAAHEWRDPVSDVSAAQPPAGAALEIPIGTVTLPVKTIPLPKPKGVLRAAAVHIAHPKPRRKMVRTSQRNDFDNFFGMPPGKQP
jgi:hypothetical protein